MASAARPAGSRGARKRVLLAWESGAGRTHYANLLAVAAHLTASGIECLAALYDNIAADREFAAIGVRTIQTFVWPGQRADNGGWQGNPVNGFTDVLATIGFKSAETVAAAIAHYDGLFSLFAPDLVLCEHAWGALLAAREHLPVIATGFCTRLPPIIDGGFPIFPGRLAPAVPVPELLAAINRGLAIAGRFPLREIGDFMRIAATFPLGLAEFDFYGELRSAPILPPTVPGLREALPDKPGDEIFVYLHGRMQNHSAVIEGLAGLPMPAFGYIPGLTPEVRARLPRMTLAEQPVPVKEIFARARAVVHQGGEQLTSACLAAGVPQVILSTWLDTRVTGGFVKAHDLGDTSPMRDTTAQWLIDAVGRAWGDVALSARCQAAAPSFRQTLEIDSPAIIARRICEVLEVSFNRAARYPGVD